MALKVVGSNPIIHPIKDTRLDTFKSGISFLLDFTVCYAMLTLDENDELSDLQGETVAAGTVEVAPGSCTFAVLSDELLCLFFDNSCKNAVK